MLLINSMGRIYLTLKLVSVDPSVLPKKIVRLHEIMFCQFEYVQHPNCQSKSVEFLPVGCLVYITVACL